VRQSIVEDEVDAEGDDEGPTKQTEWPGLDDLASSEAMDETAGAAKEVGEDLRS
jgi:hypothetical protein